MHHFTSSRKALTLIELLVVIAIIAILSIIVVLVLNPAEMLRQLRDTSRLSDMATLNSALSLYASDQNGSSLFSLGSSGVTYLSIPDPTATTTNGTDCSGIGFPGGGSFHCAASSTYRKSDGTGWIPVNLSKFSAGSPLSVLPVDPTNQSSTNLYYTYTTNGTSYRVVSVPESQKYLIQAKANTCLFRSGSLTGECGSPINFVQGAYVWNCFNGDPCAAPAFSSSTTAGDTIAVCGSWAGSSAGDALTSITDSAGNTYTVSSSSKQTMTGPDYAEIGTQCGYATNIKGGADTVSCTYRFSNYYSCSALELTPANASAPFDFVNIATGTASTPSAGVSKIALGGEFAVAVSVLDDGIGTDDFTIPGNGWTMGLHGAGGSMAMGLEYQATSVRSLLSGNFPITSTGGPWTDSMIVFQQ